MARKKRNGRKAATGDRDWEPRCLLNWKSARGEKSAGGKNQGSGLKEYSRRKFCKRSEKNATQDTDDEMKKGWPRGCVPPNWGRGGPTTCRGQRLSERTRRHQNYIKILNLLFNSTIQILLRPIAKSVSHTDFIIVAGCPADSHVRNTLSMAMLSMLAVEWCLG